MRVSEVALSDDEFLDKVTRYNNTQNAVKVSDFRSNDAIQRALAKKSAKIYRGGKQYWYKNKRSGDRDPRRTPIGMEELPKRSLPSVLDRQTCLVGHLMFLILVKMAVI